MSHIGSFLWTLASFSVGARVVVARTFDAGEILPLLREHRPTVLAMIPAALTALVRDPEVTAADFASLRVCRAGADTVSLELEREFSHLVGFLIDEGYGMTEVGLATLNPPSGPIKQGSIGRPIAGFDICVRDDDHVECELGTVGRVWIRTRSQTIGYWENPDATAEILRDGWLDSGRSRARRRRRLPVVLRAQEADHRARRLEHQPDGGGGRARRAPGGLARRRDRHP